MRRKSAAAACSGRPASLSLAPPRRETQRPSAATSTRPLSFYKVTEVSGELMCCYHHARWGLDVRALRYVGVITALSEPGDNASNFACAMPRAALGMLPCHAHAGLPLPCFVGLLGIRL